MSLDHLDAPAVLLRLPNGLTLLVILTSKHVNLAHVQVDVRVGDDDEGMPEDGRRETAHFLEHLVASMLYSRRFPDGEAKAWVEQHGIYSNAFTSAVRTSHYMSGHASLLMDMIDVQVGALADFGKPEFYSKLADGPRFAREAQAVRRELQGRAGESDMKLYEALADVLYPGHPRSVGQAFDADNVLKLTKQQVLAFVNKYYVAGNMMVTVAGPASVCDVHELAAKVGSFDVLATSGPPQRAPPPPPFPAGADNETGVTVRLVSLPNEATVRVTMVWPLRLAEYDAARHGDVLAVNALSSLLTAGFTSRLMEKLRVEDGLVYGVSAEKSLDERDAAYGTYQIDTSVAAKSLPTLVDHTFAVLRGMARDGPTAIEMEKYKLTVETAIERRQASLSPGAWVDDYADHVLFAGTFFSNRQHFAAMRRITGEDVRRAASKLIPFFAGPMVVLIGAPPKAGIDEGDVATLVAKARAANK